MKSLFPSENVYIKESKMVNAGRGVFAKKDIKRGGIIEVCPIIELPEHDASNLEEGILITYLYYFGKDREKALVALGFGSIYNHTYTPNALYEIKASEKTITFSAQKNIKKDQEITVNYNHGNPKGTNPLWFEKI